MYKYNQAISLSRLMDALLCCLPGGSSNAVSPAETSEPTDGYEFVEVKPGRVLRVRHLVPERPAPEEGPRGPGGSVSLKRRITLYRNGTLLIQNLVRSPPPAEPSNGAGGGEAEPNVNPNVDPAHPTGPPGPLVAPGARTEGGAAGSQKATEGEGGGGGGGGGEGVGGESQEPPGQQQPPPAPRVPKPKRTVVVDCERTVTACKASHADVALFFLHGVGGSLDIWGSQLDFFSRLGYEVIAPDLAGHGFSSAPRVAAAYTFYALAEDVRVLFQRYARRRNVLIGHSYGVSFCSFLAREYPDQVHKMVMINGGGPTALEPSVCSVFSLPTCVLHCLSPVLAWSFLKAGFAQQGSKERRLLKESNAFNVSSFVLRATMSGQYWPEGDELYHAQIATPVLLVHGMCDKFVPVEEDQRMAEILLLAFLKVLDNGSHMIMMECPEEVNTLLHEFLLWEPPPATQRDPPRARPATAQAASRGPAPPEIRPCTAGPPSSNTRESGA